MNTFISRAIFLSSLVLLCSATPHSWKGNAKNQQPSKVENLPHVHSIAENQPHVHSEAENPPNVHIVVENPSHIPTNPPELPPALPPVVTASPQISVTDRLPPSAVTCPIWDTNLNCPNGRVVDNQGCTQNICQPADADTNPGSCRNRIICLAQIDCLAADIGYECPSGFRVDDCGCQVAGCQCATCDEFIPSPVPCERFIDERGCPTNDCAA